MVTTKTPSWERAIGANPTPAQHSTPTPLLLEYMSQIASQLRAADRLGTARNYEKTIRDLGRFLGGGDVQLAAINEEFVGEYDIFLRQRSLGRNSRSFYMRILRATFNKAARQKLIVQSNPFSEVYTGVDRTHKRAVGEDVIRELHHLAITEGSPLALARDLFVFSYSTRGMAFVDIAFLRKSNIQGDTICYSRHKTGQPLCVKIEPCIRAILDRYANPHSPYLFPVLTSMDIASAYEQYVRALGTHNRMLNKLSKMLSRECKLTSYTPRHSWATAARNHNIPLSVISAGMGHTSEQTTRIYLSTLDNSIIDDANHSIISALF